MRKLLVLPSRLALLLVISALSVLSASAQGNERIAYVSAWDAKTRVPVSGLGADAIAIREDGVRREILRIAPAATPMAIAILVDNSQAAHDNISDMRRALTTFVKELDGIGPIAIIGVADRPTILRDFTTDQKQLLAGVGKVFAMPDSGATLLDAIPEISKGLAKRGEDRAALVVLTTENLEFSTRHYTEVLEAVKKGGAALHAVVLTKPGGASMDEAARNRSFVLDRGPRESGGTRSDVLASQAFEIKMKELAAILKSQHRVVYSRPQQLIPPGKLEITSEKAGIDAGGTQARGQAIR